MSVSLPATERRSLTLGHVLDFGEAALAELSAHRRLLNRLDWWLAEEWVNSDAFIAAGHEGKLAGAMLVAPILLDELNRLASARSSVAWLRWCALRDGLSATPALDRMFDRCCDALRDVGIAQVFCCVETLHWFAPYLRGSGFQHVEDVVTLELRGADWNRAREARSVQPPAGMRLRPAHGDDVPAILDVDACAFEEPWRLSANAMSRARQATTIFQVAEQAGHIVGYIFASHLDDEAHVTRLAVSPSHQGRGIGAALLSSVLAWLIDRSGVQIVTLNTQSSNLTSLSLYARFGFQTTRSLLRVMRYDL